MRRASLLRNRNSAVNMMLQSAREYCMCFRMTKNHFRYIRNKFEVSRLGIVPRLVPKHCIDRLSVSAHTFVHILAVQKAAPQSNCNWSVVFQIEAANFALDVLGRLLSMVVRKLGKSVRKHEDEMRCGKNADDWAEEK